MTNKRPSDQLRSGVSLVKRYSGGCECIWRYKERATKKFVYFELLTINGQSIDNPEIKQKYLIPGRSGRALIEDTYFDTKFAFNIDVKCKAVEVIQY